MSSTSFPALAHSLSECSEPACGTPPFARSTLSVATCSQNTGQAPHAILTSEPFATIPIQSPEFAADSPASRSAQLLEDDGSPSICGPRCSDSSTTSDQNGSSPKTSRKRRSPTRLGVSMDLAIQRTTAVYQGLTQGQTISEIVGGSLHTPTRKANFTAPSMQKWPSCRRYVLAFGGREITPEQFEFLMGLPIGWTELDRSETPSSRRSRKPSGERS